jgi:hypothetical protein
MLDSANQHYRAGLSPVAANAASFRWAQLTSFGRQGRSPWTAILAPFRDWVAGRCRLLFCFV